MPCKSQTSNTEIWKRCIGGPILFRRYGQARKSRANGTPYVQVDVALVISTIQPNCHATLRAHGLMDFIKRPEMTAANITKGSAVLNICTMLSLSASAYMHAWRQWAKACQIALPGSQLTHCSGHPVLNNGKLGGSKAQSIYAPA